MRVDPPDSDNVNDLSMIEDHTAWNLVQICFVQAALVWVIRCSLILDSDAVTQAAVVVAAAAVAVVVVALVAMFLAYL